MIPQPITIDGRSGTVVYLDAQWHPVTPEQATMAKVVFDDGGTAFYFTDDDARKRDYVRDEHGRFAETGAQSVETAIGIVHNGVVRVRDLHTRDPYDYEHSQYWESEVFASERFRYNRGEIQWLAPPDADAYFAVDDYFAAKKWPVKGHYGQTYGNLISPPTPSLKRDYVREPAGSPEGGQFAKTGAAFDPAKKETWYRTGGDWHQSPEGEKPYHWETTPPDYEPPTRVHPLIRGRGAGIWGGSHYGSQVMTGEAAKQMGIEGYEDRDATKEAATLATRMLQAIADDTGGSEEPLYHSFENTRQTVFAPGDTLSLPLTATAGRPADYGQRLDMEDQLGAPTYFVFPKGTPMVGYSTTQEKDLDDIGQPTVEAQYKEQGFIWDEAIVAGKFRVVRTEVRYMGSQHLARPMLAAETPQLYGQVVYLEPVEVFDPATKKWVPRG